MKRVLRIAPILKVEIKRLKKGRLWDKYYPVLIVPKRGVCETNDLIFVLLNVFFFHFRLMAKKRRLKSK